MTEKQIMAAGIAGVSAMVALVVLGFVAMSKQHTEFMEECQQHQPKYQCTALWKASQPDNITVYQTGKH